MKTPILTTTLAALLLTHASLQAALFTWNGGSFFGSEWTRTGNWTGGVVPPSDGTADLFFAGSTRIDAEATSAWSIKSLAFAGNAGDFDIQGSTLTIGSGGVTTSAATQQDIFNAIILGAAQTFRTAGNFSLVFNSTVNTNGNLLTVDAAQGNVLFFGVISGSGGLTKTGASALRLNGTLANLYSGATTVNAGSLELGKTAGVNAIAGALNVNGAASVVWQASNQIANTSAVTLTGNSVLNLNGFSDSFGSLSLTTSTVQTGAGVLTLGGNVVSPAAGFSQITGALDLGGAQRTFDVGNSGLEKDITVSATIANGSILKTGAGTLHLSGANTFAGGVTVSVGELMVSGTSAAGTGTLTLSTGGAIRSEFSTASLANPVAISGDATYGGIRNLTFSGDATMNGSRVLNVTNSNQTIFSGIISSNAALGGLTKTGSGTLTFSGPSANLYVGSTLVNDGLLILGKTAGVTAILATLTIGDGTHAATVQLNASNQIANTSSVFINAGGRFELNNFSEQIAGLTLNSATVNGGIGVLTLGGNVSVTAPATTSILSSEINLGGATRTFTVTDGPMTRDLNAAREISNGGIVKEGAGSLSLGSSDTFAGGLTVNAGEVALGSDTSAGTGALVLNDTAAVRSIEGPITLANVLTIGGNITVSGAQAITFGGTTTLTGSRVITTTNTQLTSLNGPIGQDAAGRGLVKAGIRTLSLGGTVANTFSGVAMVNEGTLLLNKPAGVNAIAAATFIVGDGIGGSQVDVVRLLASNNIGNATPVTVRASGLLDLNNHDETIPSLMLEAGVVFTGTGLLTVTGPIDVLVASNRAIIDGHLSLGGGTRTINVANGSGAFDIFIDASVENGSITKTGAGLLAFTGLQTYSALLAQVGTTKLFTPLGTGTSTVNVTPTGASATVAFNTSQTLAALSIGNGGMVILDAEPVPAPPPSFEESALAETQAVPEPGVVALLIAGLCFPLSRRCRTNR